MPMLMTIVVQKYFIFESECGLSSGQQLVESASSILNASKIMNAFETIRHRIFIQAA